MTAIAYLTATGGRLGDVKGDATERGREGSIPLLSVAHAVETPIDPATGQASGRRQHRPIVVTKRIDQASPRLLEALVTNGSTRASRSPCGGRPPRAPGPITSSRFRTRPSSA